MKILFDCFSCSPYYGSDEGIGWLWPYHMRQYHEVWAIVRKDRKPDIEKYCSAHNIHDIHFVYADIPDCMNFYYKHLKKGTNGALDFLAYQFLWQFPAYRIAKKLHRQEHFDLVHHASTNDFRLLGRMYRLKIPYVIGPIGGAQETPEALNDYVRDHKKNELLRSLLNKMMTGFPGYRKALNSASKIYVSNRETLKFLLPKLRDPSRCEIMTEVGWSGELPAARTARQSRPVTFLWAGRMEYRKGLELLFDALERLPADAEWKLVLCGGGSEAEHYKKLVGESSCHEKVLFAGKLPYEQMQQAYADADVFVFPSLRETTGTVIIEAMAHGMPVIALKQGGAAEIITEQCGTLIECRSKEQCIDDLAKAMLTYISAPEISVKQGSAAQHSVEKSYTWESKTEKMLDCMKSL